MPQYQKIEKDERGQEQPTDKKRAQQKDQQGGAGKPQNTFNGGREAESAGKERSIQQQEPD